MASEPKHAISLDHGNQLTDESSEVARIWVTNGAGSSVWIDASVLEDPMIFGYLMADTIRHAAKAYAGTWVLDEADALQSIVNGLNEELRDQVANLTTLQEGSLN